MSARLLWFAPLIVLTTLLALYGFRLGWIAAHLTETDVIEARADDYVAQVGIGAKRTDCVAFPARQGGIWIVVRCAGDVRAVEYHVNRFGGVEYSGAPTQDAAPIGDNDA